ncbi:MAG: endonuclease/exonuclease/phosphatase family protein [Candidatus Bipolaricaulis sp.]|nr:endonuclease/exonuclease/phosphatase family protein [Candidatus Bipolaricaulis sp.]
MTRSGIAQAALLLALAALGAWAAGASAQRVLVGTWNAANFGSTSDVQSRAEVVGKFDVLALQEVLSEHAMRNLIVELEMQSALQTGSRRHWNYLLSPAVGSGGFQERYAFVYCTDRVSLVAEGPQGLYPEAAEGDFVREPFFATFRAGLFDFTLVTVHIIWGNASAQRTTECQRLVSVWNWVQALDPVENDVILLGDFNRDRPTHSAFAPLRALGISALLTARGTRTTLGAKNSGGYWYDNLWTDLQYTRSEWTGDVGVGIPGDNTYGCPCSEARRGVSDHCPAWAVFSTLADDDPPDP